jgi:hypothetical protein
MKILFLFHPYVGEGLTRHLCAMSEPVFCSTKKPPYGSQPLTWSKFVSLRRRILAREFDLIVAYGCEETLWRPHRGFLPNLVHATKKIVTRFPHFATRFLLPAIRESGTRLAIFDYDDLTIIPRMRWPYLETCHLYFKMHPALNLYKSFLFQTKRDHVLWNVLKNPRYPKWMEKIRPISCGCPLEPYAEECLAPEKKHDVFFSGGTHYTPVRREGRRVLEQLQGEGLRICLPERVPHPEFLRLCSESWLTLSPEGAEWDSPRHYESALMKSVPVINYPTVRRYQPFIDGVHAIFYPPEEGLLADVIRRALADKPRLARIAEAGREHVLAHHVHAKLAEHIVTTSLA